MKQKFNEPMTGDVFHFRYPFVLEKVTLQDEDGSAEVDSWRPGTRDEIKRGKIGSLIDMDALVGVADGMGEQIVNVLSTHRPPGFQLRVFYTRKWVDPNGKQFGKKACRVATISVFRRIIDGYRHPFRMAGELPKANEGQALIA